MARDDGQNSAETHDNEGVCFGRCSACVSSEQRMMKGMDRESRETKNNASDLQHGAFHGARMAPCCIRASRSLKKDRNSLTTSCFCLNTHLSLFHRKTTIDPDVQPDQRFSLQR